MSKETLRSAELAKAHWDYVRGLLIAHGVAQDLVDVAAYNYTTAFAHGYKHAIEDERSGLFRTRIGDTPLSPAEVAAAVNAATVDPAPLDFTLPSITLECTEEEAWEKYNQEYDEFYAAVPYSLHMVIERWDCLQALQTHRERGGISPGVYSGVVKDLEHMHHGGLPVMEAKKACLRKNAERGYYSEADNARILADV
jgi:hypothetical protein